MRMCEEPLTHAVQSPVGRISIGVNNMQLVTEVFEFTEDWFSNHIPAWNKIIKDLRPRRVLEIGSYEGRATTYLIRTCTNFGALHITCVDTWDGSVDLPSVRMAGVEQRFDRNVSQAMRLAEASVDFIKCKQDSTRAMSSLVAERSELFDLIYVDGSHTAPDVLTDAVLAFELLRVGGVMVFDDYLWSMEAPPHVDPLNMPKPAIDAFTTIFMRKARVLPQMPNAQCYVEKIAN
jgi:predicted O-methyltransferase YrrM